MNEENKAGKVKEGEKRSSAPSISLPKGGGAIKDVDEEFTVNAVNGTNSLNIPLPISSARSGFSPQLSLSYNSGFGNSSFGLGWSVGIPSIKRKTMPDYFRVASFNAENLFGRAKVFNFYDKGVDNEKLSTYI